MNGQEFSVYGRSKGFLIAKSIQQGFFRINLFDFSFLPSSKPQLLDRKWGMHKKLLVSNYRECIC